MTTTTPALHQLVLGNLGANLRKLEHLMTSINRELLDAVVAACGASASDRVRHDDVDTLSRNKRPRRALVARLPAGLLPRLWLLVLLCAGLVRRRRLRGVRRVAVEDPLGFGKAPVEFCNLSLALSKRGFEDGVGAPPDPQITTWIDGHGEFVDRNVALVAALGEGEPRRIILTSWRFRLSLAREGARRRHR